MSYLHTWPSQSSLQDNQQLFKVYFSPAIFPRKLIMLIKNTLRIRINYRLVKCIVIRIFCLKYSIQKAAFVLIS